MGNMNSRKGKKAGDVSYNFPKGLLIRLAKLARKQSTMWNHVGQRMPGIFL